MRAKRGFYLVPRPELSYLRSVYRPPALPVGFVHDRELADFAFQSLHITFSMDGVANYLNCPDCNQSYRKLEIKEQKSDGDFFGIVTGKCKSCGKSTELLSRLPTIGSQLKRRVIKCGCNGRSGFLFIHAKSATEGFFEEEVIASRCLDCGKLRQVLKGD